MIKKLGHILTYHDSEPTEVLQGLIWLIFAPIVLEATFFDLWYIANMSILVGFGTLYAVVYSSLKVRRVYGYLYGMMAILFCVIFFKEHGIHSNPMNWGWVVICISALSNIRRITKKIEAKKQPQENNDTGKMYREDLENKIKQLQEENFKLRFENIELKSNASS